jgi:hypothetical protein
MVPEIRRADQYQRTVISAFWPAEAVAIMP